jgi:regulator of protease activity HflC (stomatin/prohibitin superfamily)
MSDETLHPSEGPPPAAAPGAVIQSAAIAFRAAYLVTIVLGLLWLGSNFRIISSDSQAVVMRFGRVVRTQEAGLLLAWPRPIEQVLLLPGPDRQLSRPVAALPASGGIESVASDAGGDTAPPGAAPYLTGDGNVVLLDATLIYRITDPTAYVLSQSHVAPALDRMFRASAVQVTAGWGLNDFLVAQADGAESDASITALRSAVRERLLTNINARLKALNAQGDGLGVEIDRIDMTASLPPDAKLAFDAVLTAGQKADQDVAAANTAAELRRQGAEREADRLISAAQAAAIERGVSATVNTTRIAAIERAPSGAHGGLEQQAYRDGIGAVMAKAGKVIVVEPHSGSRFILSGKAASVAGAPK